VVQGDESARLPVVVVHAALEATTATSGFLRFEGLSAHARLALQVVDPDRRFALGDAARSIGQVGDRPYQVSVAADGSLTLVLLKGIGQHHHMNESASYEWLRGLDASAVVIDMSQMEHLNSLLVAWLLQMNQGAGAGRCRLVHVGRQAVTQLSQLRLNHLLVIG
jgi:anti-anti-sigma regulatory factor